MNLQDTRIEMAGVMRCCHGTVAEEYTGKDVHLGYRSQCRDCREPFTLMLKQKTPTWVPDWQLEKE
jgi:hypothetical protein